MCSQTFPVSCRQTRMARHTFEPVRYYNSIGSHSPALTIAPGDTVATTTVDGRGFDAQDNQVTQSGNPMTGPFYIEGAEPGDTFVVSFDKLRPSRRRGWSFKMVWPTAVEPEYVRHLPWPDESDRLATWEVNTEAGTVDLVRPSDTSLGALVLPTAPMVGCFGVAPVREQVISTRICYDQVAIWTTVAFARGRQFICPSLSRALYSTWAMVTLGKGRARLWGPALKSRLTSNSL